MLEALCGRENMETKNLRENFTVLVLSEYNAAKNLLFIFKRKTVNSLGLDFKLF